MKVKNISVYLSEEKIENRIRELAEEISALYGDETVCLVCILKGSVFFTCELAKRITSPVELEFMTVSSYGDGTSSSNVVRIVNEPDADLKGRNILVIEDIVDTGTTLKFLMEYLAAKHPKSLRNCVLLDKPDRRVVEIKADFTGFVIPDEFVAGFGMDYAQQYRNLPYIGFVELEE